MMRMEKKCIQQTYLYNLFSICLHSRNQIEKKENTL